MKFQIFISIFATVNVLTTSERLSNAKIYKLYVVSISQTLPGLTSEKTTHVRTDGWAGKPNSLLSIQILRRFVDINMYDIHFLWLRFYNTNENARLAAFNRLHNRYKIRISNKYFQSSSARYIQTVVGILITFSWHFLVVKLSHYWKSYHRNL